MMSVTSSVTIDMLFKSVGYIYKGYDFTSDSIDDLELTEKLTRELYKTCCDAAEDLMQINLTLRNTGRARILLDCIAECLEFCRKYEKKNKIKKFFTSRSDKKKFFFQRIKMHTCFIEFCESALFTKRFSN